MVKTICQCTAQKLTVTHKVRYMTVMAIVGTFFMSVFINLKKFLTSMDPLWLPSWLSNGARCTNPSVISSTMEEYKEGSESFLMWQKAHLTPLYCKIHHKLHYILCIVYCICNMTRGGIYGEIKPEHEENPEAKPEGFPEASGYISPYILTEVIKQTLSISKNLISSIVLPGWAILEELILRIGLEAWDIFSRIAPWMKQYGSI